MVISEDFTVRTLHIFLLGAVFGIGLYAYYDVILDFGDAEKEPTPQAQIVDIETDSRGEVARLDSHDDGIGGGVPDEGTENTYIVAEDDLPNDIFVRELGLSETEAANLVEQTVDVYDFADVVVGRSFIFNKDADGQLIDFVYNIDLEKEVRVLRGDKEFVAEISDIVYDTKVVQAGGTVDEFLYKDALDAGLSERTIVNMAEILAFDVDFTTEVTEGDQFSVLFEKRSREGREAPDGKVRAASYTTSDGKSHSAYRFVVDGQAGYYDAEGNVLERQFLRAPLSYSRISSGFSGARFHPILRRTMAHYQIDYAAPSGTPVVATARGTVSSAGWEGGWGYIVRMRHDNSYTTHYAHLSSFADGVTRGTKVEQGDVIGYVGSTGFSTGPHLDYGMKENGVPVNPLNLDLPRGNPLDDENMKAFQQLREELDAQL